MPTGNKHNRSSTPHTSKTGHHSNAHRISGTEVKFNMKASSVNPGRKAVMTTGGPSFEFKQETEHVSIVNDGSLTQTGASTFTGEVQHNNHATIAENKELRFKNGNAKIYNDGNDGKLLIAPTNLHLNPSTKLHIESEAVAKDHMNFETGKELRFGTASGGSSCKLSGDNSKIDMVSPNLLLHGSTLASVRGATVNIDAGGTLNLQASDAENYLVCNHSSEAVETIKPLHIKSTSKVEGHCNFLTDKELRFGTASGGASCRIKGDNSTMDINSPTINLQGTTTTSLRGGTITVDAGGDLNLHASDNEAFIVCSHSNSAVEVVKPLHPKSTTIPIAGTTTTYTGDDGSIPVDATLVSIDAGGSARSGLRFASGGSLGQIIIVHNAGGEKLTFHNTEATALVKAIHANHDTMEPASVYMFVSTGALWCIIGGGKGSGTQLVAS